jgi:hypothetical protein
MFPPLEPALLDEARDRLRSYGYAVIPDAFDPAEITAEVVWAITTGCKAGFHLETAGLTVSASYVPMTTAETSASLSLLLSGAPIARKLLGRAVVPFRAKGTVYSHQTSWHRDTELDVSAVSILAYLDPLNANTGALRVLPESHLTPRVPASKERSCREVLSTRPGDLIILDERTLHSSAGGKIRRQWRADYVAVPDTPEEETVLKAYAAGIFSPGWDGGYDVTRFPSFGCGLLNALGAKETVVLRQSGALTAAEAEENYIRAVRGESSATSN